MTLAPRPRRARRQRSTRARYFANAGVVCLVHTVVAASLTASLTPTAAPSPTWPRPARFRLRAEHVARIRRSCAARTATRCGFSIGHVRERAFPDMPGRARRASACLRGAGAARPVAADGSFRPKRVRAAPWRTRSHPKGSRLDPSLGAAAWHSLTHEMAWADAHRSRGVSLYLRRRWSGCTAAICVRGC
jgi:hypothetical protein